MQAVPDPGLPLDPCLLNNPMMHIGLCSGTVFRLLHTRLPAGAGCSSSYRQPALFPEL